MLKSTNSRARYVVPKGALYRPWRNNQLGVYLGLRVCLPRLRAAGGGTIVNVASVDGFAGMPWLAPSAAERYG